MVGSPDWIMDILAAPVVRVLDISQQTYWLSYLGAAFVAASYYIWSHRKQPIHARKLRQYVLPPQLIFHPSTWLDLKFYILGSFYIAAQQTVILGSLTFTAPMMVNLLHTLFGNAAPHTPTNAALIIIPVLMFLSLELGYWVAHYVMHTNRWLWEFHKIHHNAEIMTPLTEWRQHPVEYFIFPLCVSTTLAVPSGLVLWYYGSALQMLPYWNFGLILLFFSCTMLHLRHTHLKMSAPRWLAHLIQTPAHHHIHHSTDPRHYNKNLGFCLSIWDWAFGTLHLPEKDQRIRFGITGEPTPSTSVFDHVVTPFRTLWRQRKAAR